MSRAPRVLVLYWSDQPGGMRAAIAHHLRALDYAKRSLDVYYHNIFTGCPPWLRIMRPDAVVLHTTFLCLRWSHQFSHYKWLSRWISDINCVKIALPQDEYDHSEILDEWLYELGVSCVFSVFDARETQRLYPLLYGHADFRRALTGYIDEKAADRCATAMVPLDRRSYQIVYRATHLPFWFGSHGQLKHRLGEAVAKLAEARGLRHNISTKTEDAILGERWLEFLMSGRTVIGCESGSSVLDRRGEVRARIDALVRADPSVTFEEVNAMMPPGWDDYRFFALSPRHLEAVITKTPQILVEGHYDGILSPDEHYVPVRRDLANVDEALEKVHDLRLLESVAARSYEDIYLSGKFTYRALARELEAVLDENCIEGRASRPARDYLAWSGPSQAERVRLKWHARVRRVAVEAAALKARAGLRIDGHGVPGLLALGLKYPRIYAPLAWLTAKHVIGNRPLRRLALTYVRDEKARRMVSGRQLLRDMLRASLLREGARAGLWDVEAVVTPDGSTLILRSTPSAETRPGQITYHEPSNGARRLVWDHSRVDDSVVTPLLGGEPLSIPVGDAGVYEFAALAELARRYARGATPIELLTS
jgi:hypothetical protein